MPRRRGPPSPRSARERLAAEPWRALLIDGAWRRANIDRTSLDDVKKLVNDFLDDHPQMVANTIDLVVTDRGEKAGMGDVHDLLLMALADYAEPVLGYRMALHVADVIYADTSGLHSRKSDDES